MQRRHKAMAAWLALLALAGCASVSATSRRYPDAPAYAPTDPAAVEILRNDPTIPFVRLGEVTVSLQGNPSQQDVSFAVAKAAAQMGATAAVLVFDGSASWGVAYSGALWAPGPVDPTQASSPVLVAVAIRYT